MNENNTVLENTSLFLDLDNAISQLGDVVSHYKRDEFLVVVLCEDAMPVATEVARRLGLNLTFSVNDLNVITADMLNRNIRADFDYGMVEGSGRDIPQDFIFHKEQSLRADLIALYKETYGSMNKTYPGKLIILVDQLTNINASFFSCQASKNANQVVGNTFSNPAIRDFVFMHARIENPSDLVTHGLDMMIRQVVLQGNNSNR